ncbi:MAG TPA: RimK-like ATPgrasp N-terminal domain-containing protein, partial [Gammaproteobacteria bacterium]|nr:RimK-like ATPgrasp N-terminal domain-containing protein [Gammaproteobacteria bacterium]
MQTILVTDQAKLWDFANEFTTVVSAIQYISDNNFTNTDSIRVINLCKSYQYQSLGYYVSLLAEARGHKINPSTVTIQDINKFLLPLFEDHSLDEEIQRSLKNIKSNQFILSIYFGKNIAKQYEKICHKFYNLCPLPLFRVYFRKKKTWKIIKIAHISILDVPDSHREFLEASANAYFNKKRFRQYKDKKFNFDMAILYNEAEKTAPSNPAAIQKFIQAGEELGINIEIIDKGDLRFIAEYDALFIRETTAVNHHTYQFSRRAEAEGLVVIDDPGSILKCTNKVFLSELLAKHKVPHPKTHLISKHKWKEYIHNIPTPCVLKKPDGAF